MSQTAIFYGRSDDLVEVEGIKGADEFYPNGRGNIEWYGEIHSAAGRIGVLGIYTDSGTWTFAPYLIDEADELPDWPVRIVRDPEVRYSLRLGIIVSDDAELRVPEKAS